MYLLLRYTFYGFTMNYVNINYDNPMKPYRMQFDKNSTYNLQHLANAVFADYDPVPDRETRNRIVRKHLRAINDGTLPTGHNCYAFRGDVAAKYTVAIRNRLASGAGAVISTVPDTLSDINADELMMPEPKSSK